MPMCLYGHDWYIYHFEMREFLVYVGRAGKRKPKNPDYILTRWTSLLDRAKPYNDPHVARASAAKINSQIAPDAKVKPVSVVTAEAARCLYEIRRRSVKNVDRENC